MLALALIPLLVWHHILLNLVAAYPLAKPKRIYYIKYPYGYSESLLARLNGGEP